MSQLMTYLEFTTALGNKKTLCGEEWCAITSVFIASVIKTWKIIIMAIIYNKQPRHDLNTSRK